MKIGAIVKLSEKFKSKMITNGCKPHIDEFGKSLGKVSGPMWANGEGPEIDVKWEPYGLRYGYNPEDLIIVRYHKKK